MSVSPELLSYHTKAVGSACRGRLGGRAEEVGAAQQAGSGVCRVHVKRRAGRLLGRAARSLGIWPGQGTPGHAPG